MMRLDELEAELELACMDALQGDPVGPRLYGRLRRVVEARLRRMPGVRWSIAVGPGETPDEVVVQVDLRTQKKAERIRVHVNR